jgi:primosomal protein N' (replication factor Y) (superfamily II helicase)
MLGGQVIIQTFQPEHYAIQAAAKHDYVSFYEREMAYRRQLNHPPYSQIALLTCSHTNEVLCQREAERMKKLLTAQRDARGSGGIDFIGPAPAFRRRLRNRYRWQLILRGTGLPAFLSEVRFPQSWSIDIDPVTTL